ncbi:MAG: DUF4271 domain-containing protein [Bacteroidia bacterium]|nr:DUF4271 domain-containing protein [Bacteroidia bacterium]
MSVDTLHIEEEAVKITDIVTFHSDVDSALMHIQPVGDMELCMRGVSALGEHTGLIFVVCIVASILVDISRLMSSSYISKLFSFIVVSTRGRGGVYSDLFLHYRGASAVVSVVYLLAMSVLVMESLVVFGVVHEIGGEVWLYALGGVLAYTLIKILLHIAILSGFGLTQAKDNIVRYKLLASHVEGLVLLPICIVVPFLGLYNAKMILFVAFIVIGLLLMWRLIRLFEDVSIDLLSFVNIILYLCAVELAPFACVIKALGVI